MTTPATVLTDRPVADNPALPGLRAIEVIVAICALVFTFPILLVLAIVIKSGTPGSALFRQERVGVNRKMFKFVKFRTMYADAPERFPALYEYRYTREAMQELKFKVVNDPRVTPQGKWLRTSTLDELPNFWNVLTGDMALVGPRPEIPQMLPYYTGDQMLKFSVRPGITGLAQISGRGRLSFQDTVALDLEYVRNRSLMLNARILLLTIYKLVTRDGAF